MEWEHSALWRINKHFGSKFQEGYQQWRDHEKINKPTNQKVQRLKCCDGDNQDEDCHEKILKKFWNKIKNKTFMNLLESFTVNPEFKKKEKKKDFERIVYFISNGIITVKNNTF